MIAGFARGKPLKSLATPELRPTGDKVKGAIFSLLEALAFKRGFEPDPERGVFAAGLAWPRVLDLYAGSGALGIEALSRGAQRAEFVDSNSRALSLIAQNLEIAGLSERAVIRKLRAEQAVSTLSQSYDLILADPPYADPEAAQVLARIGAAPLVTDHGVLVWEHGSKHQPPDELGRLRLRRTRRHGLAALSLYTGGSADESVGEETELSSR